ncbi:penicillin-binding protein 2 [Cellulomonas sp. PhB143]|uniref:peptidoglycan D,D-transpeptidase FtsI family protein n=1 Tax=Cellulomonas sp. PhB143 TaxID=2485186 RepID=UPI000F474ADA|nr:penicillin-binding transpeptidase domain-containing protein [Cellulomonas sp. PhB143]ROS75574.1 cell elongation-specific peptidoglycan D,D-transpeptidase [Cellulomonas sp. PhB143]
MNVPIRRVASLVLLMIVALMVSTTVIQYFHAGTLDADGRNKRATYDEYGRFRGPIIIAGDPVASSTPVDDPYGYQRKYADGKMNAAVTGFFSIVNGTSGLERTENDYLNGTADDLWFDRLTSLFTGAQPQGSSVELTIDPKAQKAAWDALGDQRGAVVAIEPSTGKILALVSKPSYDPNDLATHDYAAANEAYQALVSPDNDQRPLINRAIGGDQYPPGSTFKLITSAAALQSGDYTPETVIPAPTTYTLPGTSTVTENYGGEVCSPTGEQTLADALRMSCNTAFEGLGVKLGDDALRDQAEAFGFDQKLSIPLTVTPSRFPPDDDKGASSPARTALSAIGQGDVRATPLQMAMVSAAIANDGTLMSPELVQTVRNPDLDVVSQMSPKKLGRPISTATAGDLTSMMENVVENGTGTTAQMPGIKVAGKTGTAETGVDGESPHAWFTSFAPADDPQVAVAVVVEHGGSAGSEATGGRVAAPVAKAVMQAVIDG